MSQRRITQSPMSTGPTSPMDVFTAFSHSPSPSGSAPPTAPSPNIRGFGGNMPLPSTPIASTPSPRATSASPKKNNPQTSAAATLQAQINLARDELSQRIDRLETAWNARLENIERDLAALVDVDKGPIGVLKKRVDAMGQSVKGLVTELQVSVGDLTEDVGKIQTETSPSKESGIGCTPAQYTAVQGVVRSVVRFLYGIDPPYPDYPGPNDPWPMLPTTDGSIPTHPALRFDLSTPISSTVNSHAVKGLLDYVEMNRGHWPCDPADAATATAVPIVSFRRAVTKHFEYLRDNRSKRVKAEMIEMSTNAMLAAAMDGDGVELGAESQPSTTLPSGPARRSKKKTLSAAIKLRRPYVPEYSGAEWSILDHVHSQMIEYAEVDGGKRVFANETWMSAQNRDALIAIFSADMPAITDKSLSSKLAQASRKNQGIGSLIVEQPSFPSAHQSDPSVRLQQWQFDPAWLSQHGSNHYWNIVPVLVPTSPRDVALTEWARLHPNRPMPPPAFVPMTGEKRPRTDEAVIDIGDDAEIDGLDGYNRPVARHRSRSMSRSSSPEKRVRQTDTAGQLEDSGYWESQFLAALSQNRPGPSSGGSSGLGGRGSGF